MLVIGESGIIFCETKEQLEYLSSSGLRGNPLTKIIALTPEIAWALQKEGTSYLKLEDFYDESRLYDLGTLLLSEFSEWMQWVDGFVQEEDSELQENNFNPIHLHFHFVKIFVDELVLHMFIAKEFLGAHRSEKIFYFPYIPTTVKENLFFTQTPFSLILPALASAFGVRVQVLRNLNHGTTSGSSLQLMKRVLNKGKWLLVRGKKLIGKRRKLGAVSIPAMSIAVIHNCYDLPPVLSLLEKEGIGIILLREEDSVKGTNHGTGGESTERWDRLWNKLVQQDRFWEFFHRLGIAALRGFIEERLSTWWKAVMPRAWINLIQSRRLLEALRPNAVMTPMLWGQRDTTVMAAAKSLNIKRIIYQHGGFVGNCEYLGGWEYTDFLNADHCLFYGEGTRRYFVDRCKKNCLPQTDFSVVGSARLDRIRQRGASKDLQSLKSKLRLNDTRTAILYVTDMMMGYQRGLRCATYPAVRYFEFLSKVVGVFRSFPNARLIYKGIPTTDKFFNPTPDLLRRELPSAFIASEFRVEDLMGCVDAIVVDNPSTALLEALLTSKRILVYSDKRSLRLRPEAKALLDRRVIFSEEEENFLRRLKDFLLTGDFSETVEPDDAFLNAYGCCQNDGKSATRAAAILKNLITAETEPCSRF